MGVIFFLYFLPFLIVTAQHTIELTELRQPDINSWIDDNDEFYIFPGHKHPGTDSKDDIAGWILKYKASRGLQERSGDKYPSVYNGQKLSKEDYDRINNLFIERLKMNSRGNNMNVASVDVTSKHVPSWIPNNEKYNEQDKQRAIEAFWTHNLGNQKHSMWNKYKPSLVKLIKAEDINSIGQGLEEENNSKILDGKLKVNSHNEGEIRKSLTTEKNINDIVIDDTKVINNYDASKIIDDITNYDGKETKTTDLALNKSVWDVNKISKSPDWDKDSHTVKPEWDNKEEESLKLSWDIHPTSKINWEQDVTTKNPSVINAEINELSDFADRNNEDVLRLKLFQLITHTKNTINRKVKGIQKVHNLYKDNRYYKIGYIISYLYRSVDLLSDLYKYVQKYRYKWHTLKILNAYEQIKKAEEYITKTLNILKDAIAMGNIVKRPSYPISLPLKNTPAPKREYLPKHIAWTYYDE